VVDDITVVAGTIAGVGEISGYPGALLSFDTEEAGTGVELEIRGPAGGSMTHPAVQRKTRRIMKKIYRIFIKRPEYFGKDKDGGYWYRWA
jgi:hypothetical protein